MCNSSDQIFHIDFLNSFEICIKFYGIVPMGLFHNKTVLIREELGMELVTNHYRNQ